MDRPIDICVAGVNEIGRGFWAYAARTLVQSSALIVMLLIIDLALRNRVRATLRYWIWMLVVVKLLLSTGIGYWVGGYVSLDVPTASQVSEIVALQESPREAVQAGVVTRAETASVQNPTADTTAATVAPVLPAVSRRRPSTR